MKLSHVIEELTQEKGLNPHTLTEIIAEGILAAFEKHYPNLELSALYNKKSDEVEVIVKKTVVSSVTDEDSQISLRKARSIKKDAQEGDIISVPFNKPIGRIEILKAKQVIAQRIRNIEALAIYDEFIPKRGTIVYGIVHKCERNGTTIKLQNDHLAFLPKSLTIPGEKCITGLPIRALLKEVYPEPKQENQLILDRTSGEFLKQLFELEVPEIYEKLVEVKDIARIPGYKSKIIVMSHDKNIDSVGTCVGVGGSRIKPILRELGSEKIDIIEYSDSKEQFIKDALKPAKVDRVELINDDGNNKAIVWLDEDQRSIAIGRKGLNIALASKITDTSIQIADREDEDLEKDQNKDIKEDISD